MAEASVHQQLQLLSPSKKVVGSTPSMVLSQRVSGRGQTGGEVAVVAPQGLDLPNKGCRWATCLCPRHRQATEALAGCWAASVAQATVAVCCEDRQITEGKVIPET